MVWQKLAPGRCHVLHESCSLSKAGSVEGASSEVGHSKASWVCEQLELCPCGGEEAPTVSAAAWGGVGGWWGVWSMGSGCQVPAGSRGKV